MDDAILEYSKALALDPGMQPALQNLGMVFMQKGEWEKARVYLQKWSELVPSLTQPPPLRLEGYPSASVSQAGDFSLRSK